MKNRSLASRVAHPHPDKLTRRDFLSAGAGVIGLAALGIGGGFISKILFPQRLVYPFPEAIAAQVTQLSPTPACDNDHDHPTHSYEEGPFYAPDTPLKTDFRLPGRGGRDLLLRGRVVDTRCVPIANAVLDFWQVNDRGLYDNRTYNYRGHQFTQADGSFELKTVVPVPYYFAGLWRAAHIHVKVQGPRTRLLTTQLFFNNDPAGNARDFHFDPSLLAEIQTAKDGSGETTYNFVLETL
jgi:protocatechuate 3,4-dioxygenase beta subunit